MLFRSDESNAAFAKYNKDVFQSTYNAKTNDNAYVGSMYGDVNSKSYLKTRQNSNKSIIMKNLENWYENNLVHYEKYLADNISCVDKTIDKNSVENINFTNLGYNNNNTWYMGSDRVINNEPTLECSNNNLISNKKNGIYKIGLITTDEVLFAGGSYENRNINYYLYNNANGNNWWTLTPAKYDNGAYVWRVGASGGLYYSLVNNSYAVRPVISLKSVIMVSGKGTTSNPYNVEE